LMCGSEKRLMIESFFFFFFDSPGV
jgi:hypothetical protein